MKTSHLVLLISIALLAIAASFFLAPRLRAAEMEPHEVSGQKYETVLRERFAKAVAATPKDSSRRAAPMWQMALTTWLPSEWPPTTKTTWTRYAYGLDVALDGASGVSAPIARVERPAGADDTGRFTLVPMADKLTRIGTHPVRPHGGWRYTLDDEKVMLRQALAITGELTAGARGSIGVVSYFQSWQLGNAEIADHVAPRHRAFFDWLKKQPAPKAVPLR